MGLYIHLLVVQLVVGVGLVWLSSSDVYEMIPWVWSVQQVFAAEAVVVVGGGALSEHLTTSAAVVRLEQLLLSGA